MTDYFKLANITAKKYYKIFRNLFINNALDVDDLIQEANIATLNAIKYCEEKNIVDNEQKRKIIYVSVIRKLSMIVRDDCGVEKFKNNNRIRIKGGLTKKPCSFNVIYSPVDLDTFFQSGKEYQLDNISYKKIYNSMFLNALKTICTEQEYLILYYRFVEGYTYQEIAEKLNFNTFPRQKGKQLYDRTIKKIKKFITFSSKLL